LRSRLVTAIADEPPLPADVPYIDLPERRPTMTVTETPSTESASVSTGANTLVPYLSVIGAADAIAWYTTVLGATELLRYDGDDGRVGHAELIVSGSQLYLADEYPELGIVGPKTLGGSGVTLSVSVPDVDRVFATAMANGAESQREPADQPHGERSATIVDPFGHRWMLSTPIGTPTVDEINAAMDGFTITTAAAAPPATSNEPVELGYFTMTTPDTAMATRFYGALFGWEPEPGNMGEGYAHIANTKLPLGFAPGSASDAPELYFRVDELAPYVERVRELGGSVVAEDTYTSGGSADCRDDQGRRFQLWQPAPGY
jgi:uncharacterized glyoxalase superfamily protein PhnB